MGFWYPTTTLFGVPERETELMLQDTTDSKPFHLFATDQPFHMPDDSQPLYGSVPYVQGISAKSAEASLWVNSANTWIDVSNLDY